MPFTSSGDWWNQGRRPILKAGGSVTRDVESEDASTPLVTRSATGVTADPAKGAGLASTSMTVWRPSVRAEITAIRVTPLTAWAAVTCGGNFEVWSCVGAIGSYTVCSTSFGPAGTPLILASLTNTCLAACQDVMVGLSSLNACDDAPAQLVQIDYLTSG